MTTWTMTQVTQAKGLFAKVALGVAPLTRTKNADAVTQETGREMFKQLVNMAHPFAIELHPGDMEVRWSRPADRPWHIDGEMRWRPSTNCVELRGGHLDGQRYAVQRVGDPLKVMRPAPPVWQREDINPTDTITTMTDTYELVGWREDERVWVYAPSQAGE
jgi:hypothetical protein